MIRMMTRRWAGLGPRGTRLRDIVGSDGQRAWVPGIRINQLIVSEFLCGLTAGGSGVYATVEEKPNQEGTPLL